MMALLLAALGCEGRPEASVPGLEPPKPRDAGPDDGEGRGPTQKPPTNTPGVPRLDAGTGPVVGNPGGGMSGSSPDMTMSPGRTPPTTGEPSEEDAGSEP